MPYHKYDLPPEPRPHDIGRESAAIAIFLGLILAVIGIMALFGLVLGNIMMWVLS